MEIQFRNGETEVNGVVKKVSYEVQGDDVIVTYEEGFAKGAVMRYTMTGPDTMRTETNSYQRVK